MTNPAQTLTMCPFPERPLGARMDMNMDMDASAYFSLFKDRRMPFIIDDERLRDAVTGLGFQARHYDEYDFAAAQAPSFVLLSSLAYHARFMKLWDCIEAPTTHVALAKFDPSTDCVAYSLQQLLSIDYPDTLRRRAHYYDRVVSAGRLEVVTAAGVLSCQPAEAIELANDDVTLKPGWLYSVAEFLETSIVNLEAAGSSFRLSGRLGFDGIVYLFNNDELRAEYGATFDTLLRRSCRGGNVLEYEDNVLTRLIVGGEDLTQDFTAMIRGKERESAPSEFALGCVEYPLRQDWTRNSLMHESAHGVHVGLGMSQEIPHVDFIARGAECRFLG